MNLRTPRENPYSAHSKTVDALQAIGFTETLHIRSEDMAEVNGQKIPAKQWTISEHYRFIHAEHESENKAVYALSSGNGIKALLETPYGKFADETVDAFLRNVDAANDRDNISQ